MPNPTAKKFTTRDSVKKMARTCRGVGGGGGGGGGADSAAVAGGRGAAAAVAAAPGR